MDQIYASVTAPGPSPRRRRVAGPVSTPQFDVVIVGSGAGGGTMAWALADSGARVLLLERGDYVPQEPENWDPAAVWRHLRYRTTERWVDERGADVPAVHALQRRRQHQVLGQRPVSPARARTSATWSTATACRRRGRSTTTTLAPYYDRAERLFAVHGAGRRRSDRPAARAVPVPADPARAADGGARRAAARRRPASVVAAARTAAPRRTGRLPAVQHLQLVPVPAACEERRRSLLCDARRCASGGVTLWTGARARRLLTDPSGSRVEAVEVERDGEVEQVRRRAGRRGLRRGELGGAAAAVGHRPPSGRTGQLARAWSAAATWPTWRR